ncbi:unnamed protein product [Alopecurus aequalis]
MSRKVGEKVLEMAGHKEQGSRRPGQQERKEIGLPMVEREKEKDADMKEGEGKKFGQQFCRVFLAPKSGKRLRIPPSFSQYLQNQPTGLVCLKGPSGNTWLAELASDTEGLFIRHGWKEFVMDHSVESGDILTFCHDGHSQFSVVVFDGMCIEKPSAFHAKPSKYLVGTVESDEEDKEMSASPQEDNDETKKKSTREIDENDSKLREHSNGASVDYKSASLNSTEDSDSSYHVLVESVSCKESSKLLPMLVKFSKVVDIRGKSKLSDPYNLLLSTAAEFQGQPEVISQRPPIREEQKNYALQNAKQFVSKHPITMQIMKESYVYKTFFMIIPPEFVKDHLPRADKKFTLWDPQGKAWKVAYVYCSQRGAGAFSGGWGGFSIGNHLEKFDVCVFELFSKDNMKVHIYRANPTLTAYLLENDNDVIP